MIRSYFGVARNPFDPEGLELLDHQREILEVLRAHCQQGGLCLVAGEPGTGKSVIKAALQSHDPKRLITPAVGRTLHTYPPCFALRATQGRQHAYPPCPS